MRWHIALALLLALVTTAAAEEKRVTLRDAVQTALERNGNIRGAGWETEAAAQAEKSVGARYFPRVLFSESLAATDSPTRVFMMKMDQGKLTRTDMAVSSLVHPGGYTDFTTAITLEQPLFDPALGPLAEAAAREREARSAALEQRREEVALRVVTAYVGSRSASAALRVAQTGVEDAQEHLRLARARNEAGLGLKSDELRAAAYLAEMEAARISAGHALQLAGLQLGVAMGEEPGTVITVADDPLAGEVPAPSPPRRADLRQLEAEAARAEAAVAASDRAFYPALFATAGYQLDDRRIPFGGTHDSWSAGISLRWEIFDGLRRLREQRKARAERNAAREYLEQYRREVGYQVAEARLQREDAGQRLEVARKALADAEEGMRLVEKRYENSLATMADLLDVQTAVNRARGEVAKGETEVLLAGARIRHAEGLLSREVLR